MSLQGNEVDVFKFLCITLVVFPLYGCCNTEVDVESERKALAERFFRGVYGSDPTVVDDLASDGILVSYPIFQELFNSPSIRGRAAVKEFATGFCSRWKETKVTIHEAVVEGDRVVLLWSFTGRNVATANDSMPPTNELRSWGGITYYRFNQAGEIIAEIGEESEPGPFKRTRSSDTAK